MAFKLAFVGFRHGHINSLYALAAAAADVTIAGACEEHGETRERLRQAGGVAITHSDYGRLLDEVECDAVAVGDAFGLRGQRAVEALSRGRHVIADKPPCTRLAELERMEALTRSRGLRLGCMLTMRDAGQMRKVRELLAAGAIGQVHAITFGGQHPLLLGSRPGWYFEPGMHGGTINDIGIHA
ncbi:MAG: Gfo/Idh/MocA family oxidoreductase, partial [Gemmatimonadota bacterium]